MKIIFAAAELLGYAKAGGLADISYALPKALTESDHVFRVVPLYRFSNLNVDISPFCEFSVFNENVRVYKGIFDNVETFFVYNKLLSETDKIYTEKNNEFMRFAIFSKSVAELNKYLYADIVHLNDWHTALAAYYLKQEKQNVKIVLTIHNACYQGIFNADIVNKIGIKTEDFNTDGFEFYGSVNILKGGVAFADKVVLVSSEYAKEVLTPEFGCGLDGFFMAHTNKITSILNGIDYDEFNPEKDRYIKYAFSKNNLMGKWQNKRFFIKKIGLKNPKKPLLAFIGRLTQQKGIDLLREAMDKLLEKEINFVILGDGNSSLFYEFKNRSNFYLKTGYDEEFSRIVYAASDFIVVPSEFEPCGLVQLIGFRYGVIPIVRSVGGLKETVNPVDEGLKCGAGFVFDNMEGFHKNVDEAIKLFNSKKRLHAVRKFNLQCDFSAKKSALNYHKLFESLWT